MKHPKLQRLIENSQTDEERVKSMPAWLEGCNQTVLRNAHPDLLVGRNKREDPGYQA